MSVMKWKIKKIKLADVKMRPDNPRIISEKALNRETIEQLREKLVTYVNSIKTPKEP